MEKKQKTVRELREALPEAKRIAERTCLGLSDAMILNAFQCSRFPFIVSADFDIGYAVLASQEFKDVVMPAALDFSRAAFVYRMSQLFKTAVSLFFRVLACKAFLQFPLDKN